MKIIEIGFNPLLPTGEYANTRYEVKMQLEEGETPLSVFQEAKKMIDECHRAMYPHLYPDISITNANTFEVKPHPSFPSKEINLAHERLKEKIDDCTSEKELMEFISKTDIPNEVGPYVSLRINQLKRQ